MDRLNSVQLIFEYSSIRVECLWTIILTANKKINWNDYARKRSARSHSIRNTRAGTKTMM